MTETIHDKIIQLVAQYFDTAAGDIARNTSFAQDLGADPAELTDFFAAVEQNCDVSIDPEQAEQLTTVGELIDYIEDTLEDL